MALPVSVRRQCVKAIDVWGRLFVYRARIVNSAESGIVVKSRLLTVGKRISFAALSDLEGADGRRTLPRGKWRSGVIWRIDNDCLHLTRT
jgi:hypothetical protein